MFYDYKCRDCDHTFTRQLRMDDRKQPEGEPCPECNKEGTVYQYIGKAPTLVHEAGSRLKVDDGWREVQSKIKEKYTINNIKDH